MQYDKDGDFPALYVCRRLDGGQGFAAFAISAGAVLSAAEKYGVLFALTDGFDRIYASNAALFTGRLGKADASDEEVIEAAKKAHCHEFITMLENGYDTEVGDDGAKLSEASP
ncbi:MAG: hypothetical protein ACTTKL_10995 [Treponema sp.]